MAHRDAQVAGECCGAVARLLALDAEGDGSLMREAVQLVADLVRRRKCDVRGDVICVLLGLRLSDAVASDVKSGREHWHPSTVASKTLVDEAFQWALLWQLWQRIFALQQNI